MAYKRLERILIHLDAVDSTNNYAAKVLRSDEICCGTVIFAKVQHNGKGQRLSSWTSEVDKNLTISIILKPNISAKCSFYLNIIAALAVRKALYDLGLTSKIKWPNDVLIDKKKVCGILIENQISGDNIVSSIVGIGLNVNQKNMGELPNATSIINELNAVIQLHELLDQIYGYLDFYYDHLLNSNFDLLKKLYYDNLYLLNKAASFRDNNGIFQGKIIGINENGMLLIEKENGNKVYDIKEISYC